MKFLTTLLVLFTALFFNPVAYSAENDLLINDQSNIQQLADEEEQSENDDDSDC